jgi:hypothetical protein
MQPRTMAALRFYGSMPNESFTEKKGDELRAILAEAGLKASGNLHLYSYYPPFAPGFMRYSDVLLELEGGLAQEVVATA